MCHEHADVPDLTVLLRARHGRPRDRSAAEQRDELAPSQLIEVHSFPPAGAGLQDNRISEEPSEGNGDQR